jgi:hypothetical protein
MARDKVDNYRKAVMDTGILGKDWRKNEAVDDFARFIKASHTDEQLAAMKYDEILVISKAWWNEHHSKYS